MDTYSVRIVYYDNNCCDNGCEPTLVGLSNWFDIPEDEYEILQQVASAFNLRKYSEDGYSVMLSTGEIEELVKILESYFKIKIPYNKQSYHYNPQVLIISPNKHPKKLVTDAIPILSKYQKKIEDVKAKVEAGKARKLKIEAKKEEERREKDKERKLKQLNKLKEELGLS